MENKSRGLASLVPPGRQEAALNRWQLGLATTYRLPWLAALPPLVVLGVRDLPLTLPTPAILTALRKQHPGGARVVALEARDQDLRAVLTPRNPLRWTRTLEAIRRALAPLGFQPSLRGEAPEAVAPFVWLGSDPGLETIATQPHAFPIPEQLDISTWDLAFWVARPQVASGQTWDLAGRWRIQGRGVTDRVQDASDSAGTAP